MVTRTVLPLLCDSLFPHLTLLIGLLNISLCIYTCKNPGQEEKRPKYLIQTYWRNFSEVVPQT